MSALVHADVAEKFSEQITILSRQVVSSVGLYCRILVLVQCISALFKQRCSEAGTRGAGGREGGRLHFFPEREASPTILLKSCKKKHHIHSFIMLSY